MAFNYLNYAKIGLSSLSAMSRLSKLVCETRSKFLDYPQDMIDYYNSIAKIIYGSESVTDVTTVGDKNGFEAQAVSKLGEVFKGLSNYDVPILGRASGFYLPRVTLGMNIRLNDLTENQNGLVLESCIVKSIYGSFVVSIAYIPRTHTLVRVHATRISACDSDTVIVLQGVDADVPRCQGCGIFSNGYVHVSGASNDSVKLVFQTFLTDNDVMTRTVKTGANKWKYGEIELGAIQPGFLYAMTYTTDIGSRHTFSNTSMEADVAFLKRSSSYSPEIEGDCGWINEDALPVESTSPIYTATRRVPRSYEFVINDSQAILLMYLLADDILREIHDAL